jgi:hypothetical protein
VSHTVSRRVEPLSFFPFPVLVVTDLLHSRTAAARTRRRRGSSDLTVERACP